VQIFVGIIAFVIAAYVIYKIQRHKPLTPLLPRKYDFGRRRDTFRIVLALLEERGARTLVETGIARQGLENTRGDGGSTVVFGLWAKENSAHLDSVDIDASAVAEASRAIDDLDLRNYVSVHVGDSVQYLSEFKNQVDFLYLDSYDYSRKDTEIQERSQQHHLKEFQAIEDRLHGGTVVLIDDCNLPGGGKGKLVIEYMLSNRWKLFHFAYQAVLVAE